MAVRALVPNAQYIDVRGGAFNGPGDQVRMRHTRPAQVVVMIPSSVRTTG